MFERTPRLPVDVFLNVLPNSVSTASDLRERLDHAYKAATLATKSATKHQAKNYDRKVRGYELEVGDYVLIKNVGLKGKHKLADIWKNERYIITAKPNPDIPVYKVRR